MSILHADADCFFASVEQRDEPRLRGRPLVVATWVVMAASYEARAFGVHSAMPVVEAHRLCPDLLAVEPRGEAYAEASRELFEVFDAVSPRVEHHGLEEAFLEGPPELGEVLRRRVREDVGLPVTVGVASTKIAAKMASRAAKPDGLLVLAADDERGFLDGHRIEALWGIGRATATKLHARGIATVGEAAALGEPELIALLGRGNGRRVHALVSNRDRTPVERGGPPRSFGSTRSLGRDDDPPRALEAAAERVAKRLQSSGRAGRTITLHLRFDDHTLAARSRTLPAATADATTIHYTASALLDTPRRLTRIGVSVGNLEAADSLPPVDDLLAVMLEARRLIALPENDFTWSSFIDQEAALEEIDGFISALEAGTADPYWIGMLFLPTGPIQEVALSSGWGDAFVALADRFDLAAVAHSGRAKHLCALCGKAAGTLTCTDGELRRVSFTSVLTQRETPAVRAALGSARALYELDFELAPFYCPVCDRSYCGEHWSATDVFEDGVHDSIRGTCPEGHERMLED